MPARRPSNAAPHGHRRAVEQAFDLGQIRAHFQPQVCAQTAALLGCEALARWHHPQYGLLRPAQFLPKLAACGLTCRLGDAMVDCALSALRDWGRAGVHVPRVAVNFSQDDLNRPHLASELAWKIDRYGLTPDRLTVEILETVPSSLAQDTIARNIAALAGLGCGIDLDDFGTGHATLAAIRRHAVGRIKIDRTFIGGVQRDPHLQKMVAAITAMAQVLGLQTLAEGVETHDDWVMLANLGCDAVQGFHIAPPMAASAFAQWATQNAAPSRCLGMVG